MIVNNIGLTKDSYSHIYTADGSEIGTVYDAEGRIIYYMYRDTIGDGSRVFVSYGVPIKDYRIYGNTVQDGTPSPDMPVDVVGCGVRTENLWDPSSTELERIFEIEPSTSYMVAKYPPLGQNIGRATIFIYDGDMNLQNSIYAYAWACAAIEGNENTKYAKVTLTGIPASDTDPWKHIFVGKGNRSGGSQFLLPFIPYGYKIPVTTTNGTDTVTTPVYIGDTQLMADEYVSFSEQKIYRKVNGVLTPTDPPVPFPELPTFTGTNTLTIDTTVKPSEVDLTGRIKPSGYGQLLDKNLTAINDSAGTPIFIRG